MEDSSECFEIIIIFDFIQDFFFLKMCIFFYDNLDHFIVRAPSTSYNQMHPL